MVGALRSLRPRVWRYIRDVRPAARSQRCHLRAPTRPGRVRRRVHLCTKRLWALRRSRGPKRTLESLAALAKRACVPRESDAHGSGVWLACISLCEGVGSMCRCWSMSGHLPPTPERFAQAECHVDPLRPDAQRGRSDAGRELRRRRRARCTAQSRAPQSASADSHVCQRPRPCLAIPSNGFRLGPTSHLGAHTLGRCTSHVQHPIGVATGGPRHPNGVCA